MEDLYYLVLPWCVATDKIFRTIKKDLDSGARACLVVWLHARLAQFLYNMYTSPHSNWNFRLRIL